MQRLSLSEPDLPSEVLDNMIDPSMLMEKMFDTLIFQIKHYRKIIDTVTTLKNQYEKEAKGYKEQANSLKMQLDQLKQQKRPLEEARDFNTNTTSKSRRFTSKQQPQDNDTIIFDPLQKKTTIALTRPLSAMSNQQGQDRSRLPLPLALSRPTTSSSSSYRGGYDDPNMTTINAVSVSVDRFTPVENNDRRDKGRIQGQRLHVMSSSDPRPNTTSSLHQQQQQHQHQHQLQDRPLSAGTAAYQSDYFNKNIPRSLKPSSAGSPYKNHVQSSVIRTPSNTGIISSQTLHRTLNTGYDKFTAHGLSRHSPNS